jgi:hypothetical protein
MKKCMGGGWVPYADEWMDEKWIDEKVQKNEIMRVDG